MPQKLNSRRARQLMLVVAVVSVAAFALSGCGSSDEKFADGEAERALAALDSVQAFVEEGRCDAARRRTNALAIQSTNINEDRPELGEAYASSVARLQQLVSRECVEITPDGPTPAITDATGPTDAEPVPEPTEPTVDPGDGGGGGGGEVPPDNGDPGDGGGGNENPTTPDNSGGAAPGL